MKKQYILLASIISLCVSSESFAAKGLVIKLDVTDNAQDTIINQQIRKAAGMPEKKARHHLTIGYIEAVLPDQTMDQLGQKITKDLAEHYKNSNLQFKVKGAEQPFGNAVALIPLNEDELKGINGTVDKIITTYGQTLNNKTMPNAYTPHMTLSLDKEDSKYLPELNAAINSLKKARNGELFFKLCKFSYTVMK